MSELPTNNEANIDIYHLTLEEQDPGSIFQKSVLPVFS